MDASILRRFNDLSKSLKYFFNGFLMGAYHFCPHPKSLCQIGRGTLRWLGSLSTITQRGNLELIGNTNPDQLDSINRIVKRRVISISYSPKNNFQGVDSNEIPKKNNLPS
jgi:hypothetical protein